MHVANDFLYLFVGFFQEGILISPWHHRATSWFQGLGKSEPMPISYLPPSLCLCSRLTSHYVSWVNPRSPISTRAYIIDPLWHVSALSHFEQVYLWNGYRCVLCVRVRTFWDNCYILWVNAWTISICFYWHWSLWSGYWIPLSNEKGLLIIEYKIISLSRLINVISLCAALSIWNVTQSMTHLIGEAPFGWTWTIWSFRLSIITPMRMDRTRPEQRQSTRSWEKT